MKRNVTMLLVLPCALFALLCMGCCTTRDDNQKEGAVHISTSRSTQAIRKQLLEYTPLGVSRAKVLSFVRERLHKEGPVRQYPKARLRDAQGSVTGVLGDGSIAVVIGKHANLVFLGTTLVAAEWAFQGEKLVEIIVWKETDAL